MTPVQTSATSSAMPRALIIGAGPEALIGIEPMLGANRFRVDFLEKDSTPYIAIRQRRPDLVVLCFAPDDDEACQVLQMLQLDPATRRLPILTYVNGEAYAIIPSAMASDKRDSERVEFLGALHGEVMVFQPSAVRQMSHGGMQVETEFPAATGFPARFPSHARRPLRRRQGAHRPLAHQRRRSGHHHLSLRHRIHRAVGARRGRHPALRRRARQGKRPEPTS